MLVWNGYINRLSSLRCDMLNREVSGNRTIDITEFSDIWLTGPWKQCILAQLKCLHVIFNVSPIVRLKNGNIQTNHSHVKLVRFTVWFLLGKLWYEACCYQTTLRYMQCFKFTGDVWPNQYISIIAGKSLCGWDAKKDDNGTKRREFRLMFTWLCHDII